MLDSKSRSYPFLKSLFQEFKKKQPAHTNIYTTVFSQILILLIYELPPAERKNNLENHSNQSSNLTSNGIEI